MLEPPILLPPVEGRPLIMYMTVLDNSMGCILGQQDETGKKAKLLKKDQVVKWNDEFQVAFDINKEYFLEPPVLMPLVEGRPLIMYMTVL